MILDGRRSIPAAIMVNDASPRAFSIAEVTAMVDVDDDIDEPWSPPWWAILAGAAAIVATVAAVAHVPLVSGWRAEQRALSELADVLPSDADGRARASMVLTGGPRCIQLPPVWPLSHLGDWYRDLYHRRWFLLMEGTRRPITDDDLAAAAGLPYVEWLVLFDGSEVTDAGLSHLASLRRIRGIGLGNSPVTDAGVATLAGLQTLSHLDLHGTKVTDAGLVRLVELPALATLSVAPGVMSASTRATLGRSFPGIEIREY